MGYKVIAFSAIEWIVEAEACSGGNFSFLFRQRQSKGDKDFFANILFIGTDFFSCYDILQLCQQLQQRRGSAVEKPTCYTFLFAATQA